MRESFESIESERIADNNSNKLIEVLKCRKPYLMQRFVKLSYNKWRNTRKRLDGTYEPKWKESTDDKWNKEHGTNRVDIANSEYEDLPRNRQYERMAAASVAIDLVLDWIESWEIITPEMIEKMSSVIHDKWLERRIDTGELLDSSLAEPYENLSEKEKEKDRNHIYIAIQIIKEEIEAIK